MRYLTMVGRYKDRGHVGLTDEVFQEARAFIGTLVGGTK